MKDQTNVAHAIAKLVGKRLSMAGTALGMRMFDFGRLTVKDDSVAGEFALHLQCPWNLDGPDGIVTGSSDYFRSGLSGEKEDVEPAFTLQDLRLAEFFLDKESELRFGLTRNHREPMDVIAAHPEGSAGFVLELSDGFVLRVLPDKTKGESWRLFVPRTDNPHFVVSDGLGQLE